MGCNASSQPIVEEVEVDGDAAAIEVYGCLCCGDATLRRQAIELVAASWSNAQRHLINMDMHSLRGALAAQQESHAIQIARLQQLQTETDQNAVVTFLSIVNSDCSSDEITVSFDNFIEQWNLLSDADKRVTHSQVRVLRLCNDGLDACPYTKGATVPDYAKT